jgi:regulatory protein
MEYYCAYQERCYKEVEEKLYSYAVTVSEKEAILTHLIEQNFVNEERFAQSFVRGKSNHQ